MFTKGLEPSGRCALWEALQYYVVEIGAAFQVDLHALWHLKYKGDLALYLDGLDEILGRMMRPVDETVLHSIVEPQLRLCKPLAMDFSIYDRASEGSGEKTIKFLYQQARSYLRRSQMDKTKKVTC